MIGDNYGFASIAIACAWRAAKLLEWCNPAWDLILGN